MTGLRFLINKKRTKFSTFQVQGQGLISNFVKVQGLTAYFNHIYGSNLCIISQPNQTVISLNPNIETQAIKNPTLKTRLKASFS